MRRKLFGWLCGLVFATSALYGQTGLGGGIFSSTFTRARTVTFTQLGAPLDGSVYYCSNCTQASPCASGGTGALATRINGAWSCTSGGAAPSTTATALQSATTVVNVSSATAPTVNQVLTATDSTHATWQAASSAGANTALSNLASTAVNVPILPGTDNSTSLGDGSHRFLDVFTSRYVRVPVGSSAGVLFGANQLSYDTGIGLSVYDADKDSTIQFDIQNVGSSTTPIYSLPAITTGTLVVATAAGTTVGAAGGASALPALPAGYITVVLPSGASAKIPYYTP
jgi:hypothetical protein